jgi:putative endonuclease
MSYYVYILSNNHNTTIYTGVTNDLIRRVYEHKNHLDPSSFSARYHVEKLVYYEIYSEPELAIAREKQIKSWSRKRKNELIEKDNSQWTDLYPTIL